MPARARHRAPRDSPDRAFHIGDVLSAVTGVVLSPRGEPGVEAFYTHVLGRAVRMPDVEDAFYWVREHVLAAHPGLGTFYGIEVPTYEFAGAWVRRRSREFGAYLRIAPLPDGHPLHEPPPPGPPNTRPPYPHHPPAAAAADRHAVLHAAVLAAYAEICALADAMDGPAARSADPPGTSAASPPERRVFADYLLVKVAADVPWPVEQTVLWAERPNTGSEREAIDAVPCLGVFTSLTHHAIEGGVSPSFAPTLVPRTQLGRGRPVRVAPATIVAD